MMGKAEAPLESAATIDAIFELKQASETATVASLREAVDLFVRRYLDEIDGELSTDFYALVLSEVEGPLLKAVMEYTRHNQTRAAHMLGLNRGTLRKKLRENGVARRRAHA